MTIIYDERHFELLDSWRSKLIRPENAAGWALLAIHEETSLTRPYEFVVTLLLKLINGEDIVIQIHYPELAYSTASQIIRFSLVIKWSSLTLSIGHLQSSYETLSELCHAKSFMGMSNQGEGVCNVLAFKEHEKAELNGNC